MGSKENTYVPTAKSDLNGKTRNGFADLYVQEVFQWEKF